MKNRIYILLFAVLFSCSSKKMSGDDVELNAAKIVSGKYKMSSVIYSDKEIKLSNPDSIFIEAVSTNVISTTNIRSTGKEYNFYLLDKIGEEKYSFNRADGYYNIEYEKGVIHQVQADNTLHAYYIKF